MARRIWLTAVLLVAVLCSLAAGVEASGTVTFYVQVVPGLKISSPDQLTFEPVAPGQSDVQELSLTVWSNVRWQLLVEANGYGAEGGLSGTMEVGDSGIWHKLSAEGTAIYFGQAPTGPDGVVFQTPFRFTGSYDDEPGDYDFQVKFTVVPAL